MPIFPLNRLSSVSYTHLDVYKRQPLYGVRPPEDGALLLYAADLQGGKGGLCENRGHFEKMRSETVV